MLTQVKKLGFNLRYDRTSLTKEEEHKPFVWLTRNVDLFTRTPYDMPEIDIRVVSYHLTISPSSKPVAQRKQKVDEEKRVAIEEEVGKLSSVRFIIKRKYPTRLANMVLVRKANNIYNMCIDFTDLNTACHKDPYPLLDIDRLINGSSSYHTLNFMDAY